MQVVKNSSAWLNELLTQRQPPCVSIYIPMQRAKPYAEHNRMAFRDMFERARAQMSKRYSDQQMAPVLEKLQRVGDDEMLGSAARDGLAIFASADFLKTVELQRSVDAMVEVADSFHIKPLLRIVQQGARLAVLCLSPNDVRLYEGNQYEIRQVELRNVPRNVNETLDGLKGNYPGEAYGEQHKMRPGQPPTDKDNMGMEPFLRAVDQSLWENYSRESRLPIVVCADTKPLMQFIELTKNEYVLPQGINHSPQHMSTERLREEAWQIIEPRYTEELERLKDQFRTAKAHQKGSDELKQVAQAAAAGRVGTLLIDEQTKIPGILDRASGTIESIQNRPEAQARADDVLDDLAEMVLQMDGQVYVIPHEQMPTDAGVAAMYRY